MILRKRKPPADMLTDIGRALYGEHWRFPLARGVGVNDETIRRWMNGHTVLPPDHGVFANALGLLKQREQELGAMRRELTKWMKDQ